MIFKCFKLWHSHKPGPCITTVIWCWHNPFKQWQCSFQWRLCSHWLKIFFIEVGTKWLPYWMILHQISLTFVTNDPVVNTPILVQIMAWCWIGSKPLASASAECGVCLEALLQFTCVSAETRNTRPRSVSCVLEIQYPKSHYSTFHQVLIDHFSLSWTKKVRLIGI